MSNVLVICPHPDDESIGCGGTIINHISHGRHLKLVFLTSGDKGGHGRDAKETVLVREREARNAGTILGVRDIEFWRIADGAVRATANQVERMAGCLLGFSPSITYLPYLYDKHPDHRAAARIVKSAARNAGIKCRYLMYEVWTPIRQIDEITDITNSLQTKKRAIQAHVSQCEALRFDEAATGLARYRGELFSWPKSDYAGAYAEVFQEMKF